MIIQTTRNDLLEPLQQVTGVVERRQTLPILSNVLFNVRSDSMSVTATDLEVELKTECPVSADEAGDITLPARKLLDICKALPEEAAIEIRIEADKATLRSGRGRYTLGVLPAQDFPSVEANVISDRLRLREGLLKRLIEKTQFAMAQQDVRYYLNGLLFEIQGNRIRAVATDGHRLALSESLLAEDPKVSTQLIVPRKAVLELSRLLSDGDGEIELELSSNHIRIHLDGGVIFTSKLIDGRFPDYERVIPASTENAAIASREELRQALVRASILSNEKYRGIRFKLTRNALELLAHNPEQEEAEETLEVQYTGPELTIGFNVGYLLDVLGTLSEDDVRIALTDANSSSLISSTGSADSRYVVMPMRL